MDGMNDSQISKVMEQYKKKQALDKARYERLKGNQEFVEKNRQRARDHYALNKHKKKERYDNDKDFMNAKSSYYYYRRQEKLEFFKEKYPERTEILRGRGYDI